MSSELYDNDMKALLEKYENIFAGQVEDDEDEKEEKEGKDEEKDEESDSKSDDKEEKDDEEESDDESDKDDNESDEKESDEEDSDEDSDSEEDDGEESEESDESDDSEADEETEGEEGDEGEEVEEGEESEDGQDVEQDKGVASKIKVLQKQYNDVLVDAFTSYAPECIQAALEKTGDGSFGENIEGIIGAALEELKGRILADFGIETCGACSMTGAEGMSPISSMENEDEAGPQDDEEQTITQGEEPVVQKPEAKKDTVITFGM